MSRKYLFVGGPADGDRREVNPEVASTFVIDPKCGNESVKYRRFRIGNFGDEFVVYVVDGVPQDLVCAMLIDGYRNPVDPVEQKRHEDHVAAKMVKHAQQFLK